MGQFGSFMNEKKEQSLLLESGFSRLMQIISGLVPSVKSFAIVTWENPKNIPLPAEENNKRNEELKGQLARGAHGFIQIKGKYGKLENPFVIMNIPESEAIALGENGYNSEKQESIIYGIVNAPQDITFKLIYTDGSGSPTLIRHVWTTLDVQGKTDYYSEYKGRKFIIPFFDDYKFNYDAAKFKNGTIIGREKKPPESKNEGIEIMDSYNIFHADKLPATLVEEVEKYAAEHHITGDNNNRGGMGYWSSRGYMYEMLKKAKKV